MIPDNKYHRKKNINAYRYQVICEILNMPTETHADIKARAARIKIVASENNISAKTVRRWVKLCKNKGFEGLIPAYRTTRSDKRLPACFDEALERAKEMRQSDNTISVVNIIRCLESEKPELKNRIQRSTLQKHLQDEGMARRDLVTGAAQHGRKNLGRFQKKHRMDLCVGDIKEPANNVVLTDDGKSYINKIYIAIFIDNCHRSVLDFQICAVGNADLVLSSIYNVIKTYGKPKALHLDNGSQYRNAQLSESCRLLNIKLKYCGVKKAWEKGSLERLNKTIDDYLHEVENARNIRYTQFCEGFAERIERYNNTPHSNEFLNGKTPLQSFNEDDTKLSYVDDLALANAFQYARTCMVYKDGCVKYKGKRYVIPAEHIPFGRKVIVMTRPNSKVIELYTEQGPIPIQEQVIGEYVNKDSFKTDNTLTQKAREYPVIDMLFREKLKKEGRYTTEEEFREWMKANVYKGPSEINDNKIDSPDDFNELCQELKSANKKTAEIRNPYSSVAKMNPNKKSGE